tara:strand:- start:471 stop:689 length:219 start_codon:yes stop_codon:yes gene_type:complete
MAKNYIDQLDKFTLQKLGIKKVIQVDGGYIFYELCNGLVTDLRGDSWDNLHQFKDDLDLYDTDNTSYKITEI